MGQEINIANLRARAADLERELDAVREQLRQSCDPETLTAQLVRDRAYVFDANAPIDGLVGDCADSLSRYGFCVLENAIPESEIEAIRMEVAEAGAISRRNTQAIGDWVAAGRGPVDNPDFEVRPVRRAGHPPRAVTDIIWMPRFARHMAHPTLTTRARHVLDDHLRIAQLQTRTIEPSSPDEFGTGLHPDQVTSRGWHTDWPHDLSAYGMGDALENVGCVRHPFPDLTLALVTIWYLTDVDADSGGTWVVPGSHRDGRNPRGPDDGIVVTAPLPGDMQVTARAGSVYVQDSRSWHAAPRHNFSDRARVAAIARWCPWWVAADDFAPGKTYSTTVAGRPLSQDEFRALPAQLQPLMRHLCPDEVETLQQPVLDRSAAAHARNAHGFRVLEEDPETLARANAHVRVSVPDH